MEPSTRHRVALRGFGGFSIAKKAKTARGRKQDRPRVAGGQDCEVRYTAKKSGCSASSLKKAVKKVGSSRKRVTKALIADASRNDHHSPQLAGAAFRC